MSGVIGWAMTMAVFSTTPVEEATTAAMTMATTIRTTTIKTRTIRTTTTKATTIRTTVRTTQDDEDEDPDANADGGDDNGGDGGDGGDGDDDNNGDDDDVNDQFSDPDDLQTLDDDTALSAEDFPNATEADFDDDDGSWTPDDYQQSAQNLFGEHEFFGDTLTTQLADRGYQPFQDPQFMRGFEDVAPGSSETVRLFERTDNSTRSAS